MKVLNFKENLRRIEKIKAMQDMKDGTVKLIGFDDWVYSDDESACFADYFDKKTKNLSEKTVVILDDMGMGSNYLYLPYEPLYFINKPSCKLFYECFDDAKWLSMYIEVVSANEASLADSIDNAAFQDFLQHYKTMSIEEMVARYSDHQKWFTGNKYK